MVTECFGRVTFVRPPAKPNKCEVRTCVVVRRDVRAVHVQPDTKFLCVVVEVITFLLYAVSAVFIAYLAIRIMHEAKICSAAACP